MKKNAFIYIVVLFATQICIAQYSFYGKVSSDYNDGAIYLSLVEDYHKISGVFPEQILDKTNADSLGNFKFLGNKLDVQNRLYRIHIDNCTEEQLLSSHFTGHCLNSKEVVFIANNNTTLNLPFSFEDEMFCKVLSSTKGSNALMKLDSLKNDMKFAFGTYRSEANRKLNSERWFREIQDFGKSLDEPLAELYAFSFLSDRSSSLHAYYLEDMRSSSYYDELLQRLQSKYPKSQYTSQFEAELKADKVLASAFKKDAIPPWAYIAILVAMVSIGFNVYYFRRKKKDVAVAERPALSNQEEKVLALILDNKTNKEIAALLFVSVSTVKTHINNIYKKLNVNSRGEVKKMHSK